MNVLSFLCDGSLINVFLISAITDILKDMLSSSMYTSVLKVQKVYLFISVSTYSCYRNNIKNNLWAYLSLSSSAGLLITKALPQDQRESSLENTFSAAAELHCVAAEDWFSICSPYLHKYYFYLHSTAYSVHSIYPTVLCLSVLVKYLQWVFFFSLIPSFWRYL